MLRETRALVFDLDDTLYPVRRYLQSAFTAIAAHLARRSGLNPARTVALLRRALESDGGPGHECDRLIAACGLPHDWLPELVAVARAHDPALRLSGLTRRVLETLRHTWAIGLVTNGVPEVQALKIRALGLAPLLDTVVYASEHGTGLGKPEPHAFLEVARRLDVDRSRIVFVGDDEARDVAGARAVGMRTIRVTTWTRQTWASTARSEADAVVRSLAAVPSIADALVTEVARHAA
jgi:putative hydrolase of the HAD superfamily